MGRKWFNILDLEKTYLVVRLILGGIFVYSGSVKLLDLEAFSRIIEAWGMVPWKLLDPAAAGIASVELAAGTGLILDIRTSLGWITAMLLAFMALLSYGIIMGYDIDCGCFGPSDPQAQAFHSLREALVRDAFMGAAAVFLYVWRLRNNHTPIPCIRSGRNLIEKKRKGIL